MLRLTKIPWVLGFDIYHIWFYDEKMLYDFSFYHIIIIFRSQFNFTSCVPFLPHPQPWTSNPDSDIPITIISQVTFYSCNRIATRAGRSRNWGKGIERQEVIFPSDSKWEGEANAILMSSASPVILDLSRACDPFWRRDGKTREMCYGTGQHLCSLFNDRVWANFMTELFSAPVDMNGQLSAEGYHPPL